MYVAVHNLGQIILKLGHVSMNVLTIFIPFMYLIVLRENEYVFEIDTTPQFWNMLENML